MHVDYNCCMLYVHVICSITVVTGVYSYLCCFYDCLKGADISPPKPDEFASGDFVRVELELETFRMIQEVHGVWSNEMGEVR